MIRTADGGYRFPGEYGSSVRFTTNSDGTPVMVAGFWYAEAASWWPAWFRYAALSIAMMLLKIAPLWAAGVLLLGAVRRRRVIPHALVVWPAVAALACAAISPCLELAFMDGVIGLVHPLTIAVCALTILFAVASTASLVTAIRWSVRPDRPPLLSRLFPTVCGVAFAGLTLWLAVHGLIGFRTWAW